MCSRVYLYVYVPACAYLYSTCIRIPTYRWPSATFVDAHSMTGSCRSYHHLDAMRMSRALCVCVCVCVYISKFPIPTAVCFLPPSISMRYALARSSQKISSDIAKSRLQLHRTRCMDVPSLLILPLFLS